MKRLISIILVYALLQLGLPQPRQEAKAGGAIVIFVIGCTAAAAGAIWYIWVKLRAPAPGGTYYWALEKSYDHVNWTGVATNSLRMVEERAWDAFEVQRVDNTAFYRLRMVDFINPTNGNLRAVSYPISGTAFERPIPQQ